MNRTRTSGVWVATLLVTFLTGANAPGLDAKTFRWVAGRGGWPVEENWRDDDNQPGIPSAADDAVIDNAGTAQLGGAVAFANILSLGLTEGHSGNLQMALGVLNLGILKIGCAGTGTATQSGNEYDSQLVAHELWVGAGGPGTFNLSGGRVACDQKVVLGAQNGLGQVNQSGGTLTAAKVIVGGMSGHGQYNLSDEGTVVAGWIAGGDDLYVGEYGSGEFVQTGGTVEVRAFVDDQGAIHGGKLYVGWEGGVGKYTLDGPPETTELKPQAGIDIGDAYPGRFELYDGKITTPQVALTASGTLALALDFDVATPASGHIPLPECSAELVGLDVATLEVINGATAIHQGNTILTVGRLNIGSTDDPPDGAGTYTITSQAPTALEAGTVFVALIDAGTLNIGDAQHAVDPNLDITGTVEYEEMKYASLYLGADSVFKVADGSSCRMTFSDARSVFVNKVPGDDGANVDGLGRTRVIFNGGYFIPATPEVKTLEVAGKYWTRNPGGEDPASYFNASNFALKELVVGKYGAASNYGLIILSLMDDSDNQAGQAGEPCEALYVNNLVIEPGGTFELKELHIYYRQNGGNPRMLYMGDANLDGWVDYIDLGILATHYGESGTVWAEADFNGDRVTDYVDLGILATNYGLGGMPGEGRDRGENGGEGEAEAAGERRDLPALEDVNGDGTFDIEDVRIILNRWEEGR